MSPKRMQEIENALKKHLNTSPLGNEDCPKKDGFAAFQSKKPYPIQMLSIPKR
jgi:hypothetical protein